MKWVLSRVHDGLAPRIFTRHEAATLPSPAPFLHRPELLILDEAVHIARRPRNSRSPSSFSARLARRGATIIMSTHQIREAMELASERGPCWNAGKNDFLGSADERNGARSRLALSGRMESRAVTGLGAAIAIAKKKICAPNCARRNRSTRRCVLRAGDPDPVQFLLSIWAAKSFWKIAGGLALACHMRFAGALIVNRSFAREIPNDTLDVFDRLARARMGYLPRQGFRVFRDAHDRGN